MRGPSLAAASSAVAEALAEEQPRLLPLPEHPFACQLLRAVSSGKTPYIRFDGNDYSIPHTLVRRPLTLVASEHLVRLLDGSDRGRAPRAQLRSRAAHRRRRASGRARPPRSAAPTTCAAATASGRACPHADAFLDALALRGEPARQRDHALAAPARSGRARRPRRRARRSARARRAQRRLRRPFLDQRRRARRQPPPDRPRAPRPIRACAISASRRTPSAPTTPCSRPAPADEETPDGSAP